MADNVVKLRKLSRGFILLIIIAVAVLIGLLSSFYQIQPGYEVIILRLGKRQRQVIDPGLHWKLPFGVETIIREKINEIRTIEFGYRTERSGVQTVFSTQAFPDVSLLITGDLNIADVKWAVRYEISDLYKYRFTFHDPEKTIADVARSVMGKIIGDSSISEVITYGKEQVLQKVLERMRSKINEYDLGVHIRNIFFHKVEPPAEVKESYNEENLARQEREKLINESRKEYNRVIPKARGEAERMLAEARGYKTERINEATGKADRFRKLYSEYVKNREVTKQRLYIETLKDILPKLDVIIIDGQTDKVIIPADLLKSSVVVEGGVQ